MGGRVGKGWCHVPTPSSPKDRYPPWMGGLHCTLCKDWCQRTGGPNGQEKDVCWLESSSDRIGRSPWVLKVALFFKSFLLRGTPGAPCSCIMPFLYTQSLVVRRNEKERRDRKLLYVISSEFSSWTKVNSWEHVSHDVFKNLDLNNKKYVCKMQCDSKCRV